MSKNLFIEHGKFIESKRPDGSFPVRIIKEGAGSTGLYFREALERSKDVFAGLPVYANHPPEPEKPWTRDVTTIMGKLGKSVEYREVDGVAGLYTEFFPGKSHAEWVDEFSEFLDMSIYVGGEPKRDESGAPVLDEQGRRTVEYFIGGDPYNSVDLVVAGGAGGTVMRAMESLRAIEASINDDGVKPGTASVQEKEKEMNPEEIKALIAESLKPFTDFIAEQKANQEKLVEQDALEKDAESRVQKYAEAEKLISEANLLPSQVESLRAEAIKGVDIAPLIESAKKIRDEAVSAVSVERLVEGRVTGNAGDEDLFVMGVRF